MNIDDQLTAYRRVRATVIASEKQHRHGKFKTHRPQVFSPPPDD